VVSRSFLHTNGTHVGLLGREMARATSGLDSASALAVRTMDQMDPGQDPAGVFVSNNAGGSSRDLFT
jgi:hypothetical protein